MATVDEAIQQRERQRDRLVAAIDRVFLALEQSSDVTEDDIRIFSRRYSARSDFEPDGAIARDFANAATNRKRAALWQYLLSLNVDPFMLEKLAQVIPVVGSHYSALSLATDYKLFYATQADESDERR